VQDPLGSSSAGGMCPYRVLWRGAQSQAVSQLMNVGTMPTMQVPDQFNHYSLLKHLRTGSVHMLHILLTTQMDPGASE
jgi:hypothetical protein